MQVHLQLLADLPGGAVIVGVDVQGVVVFLGADVSSEHLVHIKAGLHVEIQQAVDLADLLRKIDFPCGEVARGCDLSVIQLVQQNSVPAIHAEPLLAEGVVGGSRYVAHGERLPAVHDVDSGELPFVEVQLKRSCDLAGVLHADENHLVELLEGDSLPLWEQL